MTMTLVGKRLGNYDIQSQIGEGGMGAVYLGHHPTIGKRVAIKVLHEELCEKPDVVNRFFNEAKAVNDISHPNIVDIIDFGDTVFDGKSCKYIIMEFLDGESLSSRIRREGVTIRDTIQIIAQTASALAASHSKGVIHRDLKPENVYLCNRPGDRNYVKLLDFGIAKLTSENGAAALSQKTRTGMVIGTPTYMAPEQCDGKGNIDARADIYAIGVMMYELLTGRVPFPGEGFGEILVAHLTREPEPPRSLNANIPPELEAIVLRCLRKRREERFQSMNDLLSALADPGPHYQAFLAGAPAPTGGVPPNPQLISPSGPLPIISNPMGTGAMSAISSNNLLGQTGAMQMGTAQQQAMRSPSAVWAVVNPNMPPGMQQMQMMAAGQPLLPQMQMQMMAGGQPVTTGMMMTPGMTGDMMPVSVGVGPRPTTLSGASAEQSSRRRPLNVLFGFIGAIVIVALVVLGARKTNQSTATPPPVTPPVEPMVSVVIKTSPPAAEVLRSDQDNEIGKTPYAFKVKKGGKPVDIKVRLAGFREEARTLSANDDQIIDLILTKEAPSEPVAPSETISKPKRSRKEAREAKEAEAKADSEAKSQKDSESKAGKEAKAQKAGKDGETKDATEKPSRKRKDKGDGDGIIRPVF